MKKLNGLQFDRERNGGLYDRGNADSYYSRKPSPHWWPEGTGFGKKVEKLNQKEIDEYMNGYIDNEEKGLKKEYEIE